MGILRQEYWIGLPWPLPGDLPNPGIELVPLCLLQWQVGSLPLLPSGKQGTAPRANWDSVFSDLAEHLAQVGGLVGKHDPISPISCPLQTDHGEHALRPQCLLDTEWKSLTWNPETGMGWGREQKLP